MGKKTWSEWEAVGSVGEVSATPNDLALAPPGMGQVATAMVPDKTIAPDTEFSFTVTESALGERLDNFLAAQFSAYSRSFFKRLIADQLVRVNQQLATKPGVTLKLNDLVLVKFPPAQTSPQLLPAIEKLSVQVLAAEPDFLVLNKPAGLVVHLPQHDFYGVTLVDWIAHHFQEIKQVGYAERPGIVHRLDLQTSGLMLVARNNFAQGLICDKFRNREMHKTYLAVVHGHPAPSGEVDLAVMRHPKHRNRMTVVPDPSEARLKQARSAFTSYRVLSYLPDDLAILEVRPKTGRMHQIRVHLAALGHPIVGDAVYGTKSKLIERQALHAYRLSFDYCGQDYSFTCPVPEDLQRLIPAAVLAEVGLPQD